MLAKKLKSEFDNIDFLYYYYATYIINLAVQQGLKVVGFELKKLH